MSKIGLVLTGGGARAAYQIGALKGISEITSFKENPFNVISGVSAGAINATWIASQTKDFQESIESVWEGWRSIEIKEVFKTDPLTFLKIGASWLGDLSLPGRQKHTKFTYLIDASPLIECLKPKINFEVIQSKIANHSIHGIAVTATNYHNGKSVTFFDGDSSVDLWNRKWNEARRTTLKLEHVLASSSIPVLFSPIELEDGFYGDGGVKLTSPLSPPIHMGAEKVLTIGIHHETKSKAPDLMLKPNTVSMGEIIGTLLNSLFFHSIEEDVARMMRINRTISLLSKEQQKTEPDGLRKIPLLAIQPSQDLGVLASDLYCKFPKALKYLLHGLGASDVESWDFISYLAFEKEYVSAVLELGYKDALACKDDIVQFFNQ